MAVSSARTTRATAAHDVRDTVRSGDLEVDRAPVTNRRYAAFVAATGHRAPLFWPQGTCPDALLDHPVTGVDFFDALAFALWVDGSLPTEEQWVQAAGLTEPAAYAWGDHFDAKRCNTAKSGIKGTTPVGAYPKGAAPSGCVDLCGNVWEMTCTAPEDSTDSILVKGGSWSDLPAHARLDTRFRTRVNKGSSTVGFRLVYGVPGLIPAFIDRALVDQCIGFRRANAPHFDAMGDDGEFEAIVESLRQTAAPHLAQLDLEARAALVGSETGAPAPEAPGFLSRLGAAVNEVAAASFWRKILPVLRVFARPGSTRSPLDRFRFAWAEAQRPRRGVPFGQALSAAAATLFPDRGRALKAGLRGAAKGLLEKGAKVISREAPRARVTVRPPTGLLPAAAPTAAPAGILGRPRRLFLLLCVFAGSVLGLLGTVLKRHEEPAPERAPVREAVVPEQRPASEPAAKAAPPPSTTKQLTAEDLEAVLRRLGDGRSQDRDEAERFLILHRDETSRPVRDALARKLDPQVRASLEYVMAAVDEESTARDDVPTVVSAPPRQGLVLIVDSLDSAEEIAAVRRTAKAARIEATIVLHGGKDAARTAKRYAQELGDVRLYLDPDGALSKSLRIERLPAVAGLRADGEPAFLMYGRIQRSRLADNVTKLDR